MSEIFASPRFGVVISILFYEMGLYLQKKTRSPFLNPYVIAILSIMAVLKVFDIPYESYAAGGEVIQMFLASLTACLAVSVYSEIRVLKEYAIPILAGCASGSLASMGSVYLLCKMLRLDQVMMVSLLPKSVTTSIAIGISNAHGGLESITVFAVVFSGILGSMISPFLIKIFKLRESVSIGLAIGASSHAVGTSRAFEIGRLEGAMSSLAMGICGIMTVLFSMFFFMY